VAPPRRNPGPGIRPVRVITLIDGVVLTKFDGGTRPARMACGRWRPGGWVFPVSVSQRRRRSDTGHWETAAGAVVESIDRLLSTIAAQQATSAALETRLAAQRSEIAALRGEVAALTERLGQSSRNSSRPPSSSPLLPDRHRSTIGPRSHGCRRAISMADSIQQCRPSGRVNVQNSATLRGVVREPSTRRSLASSTV
jgi:uncharacterized coiled-coil protein SlyX